jgi:lipopolysaccharide export system protein LptC
MSGTNGGPVRTAPESQARADAPEIRHVDSPDMAFMTAGRSPAEFARAQRHSRRVRFLKLALPLGGVAAIVLIVSAYVYSQLALPSIDPGEARIVDGKLIMNNPKIAGTDSKNRPYNLTAVRAVQDAERPTRITLETIEGNLTIDDKNSAAVTAGVGIYDSLAKTLDLSGKVAVDTKDGMSLRMEGASIDIESGKLVTTQPVSIDTGRARISAQSLTVEDKGNRIIFENRVRMTLMPIDPKEAARNKSGATE